MSEDENDWKSVSDDSINDVKTATQATKTFDIEDEEESEDGGNGGEHGRNIRKEVKDDDDDDDDIMIGGKGEVNYDIDENDDGSADHQEDFSQFLDSMDDNDLKPKRSISHDDLLAGTDSNRQTPRESRSAGSNRPTTQSFDTEEGSASSSRRTSLRKMLKKQNKSAKDRLNSDESDETLRGRDSSDELSPRFRLESFDNPFSFDDIDMDTPKNNRRFSINDDDDDDDESFNLRGTENENIYSDPSDDENDATPKINSKQKQQQQIQQQIIKEPVIEPKQEQQQPQIKQPPPQQQQQQTPPQQQPKQPPPKQQQSSSLPNDYFENEQDSNSNLFPGIETQPTLSLTNSLKNLHKVTSTVTPVDIVERARTESDKSRGRVGSDKENEIRTPFLSTSFSSTNSSSVSPEPPRSSAISAVSPKSPPSLISDQIIEDPSSSSSSNLDKMKKPSPLQVMTSERWNTPKKTKPIFAKFTEVHSFANAVKIVPDTDGALVLCATADSTVRLIDAISGRVQGLFEGHSDRVLAVSINEKIPDAVEETIQYVVAGSRDETVCVWNFKTRACLQVLSGHDGAVWAVAVYVSSDGPPLAFSGSSDCSIRSWNILTGELQHIFKGHSDTVLALTIYNGGQHTLSNNCRVISGGADHMVRVWDMSTGRHCRMLEGHTDDVNAVAVVEDPFGNLFKEVKIVSGGRDRTIRVWDLQRGAQIAEFPGHADCVYGVCGMVGRFQTLQGVPTTNKSKLQSQPSNRGTVIGNINRSPSLWTKESHGSRDNDEILPEIFLIVSCSEDRTIKLWDVLGERLLMTSKLHKGSVKGISLSPIATTGSQPSAAILLTSCSWDKSVIFYDLDTLLTTTEKKCCVIS